MFTKEWENVIITVNNGQFNSETAREAGKKSRRGISERAKILNDLFTGDRAKAVFLKLEKLALEGNPKMIETYLAYCFGKPEAKMDITSDGDKIGGADLSALTTDQLNQLRGIRESLQYK